jgi:predicted nucleic acid-binding protein
VSHPLAKDRVLLDTCVLIDLPNIDLGDLAESAGVVSAVTIAELAYGLDIDDPVQRLARTERYNAVLASFDVLPFDTAAAKIYGVLAALVRRAGRNPRPRRLDLQIAATAASNGVPLITRNPTDFQDLHRVVTVRAV